MTGPCPTVSAWQEVLAPRATLEVDHLAHLDRCAGCRETVALLAGGGLAVAEEPPERAPVQIGRFAILEACGEGAMGVVFKAHDPTLDRAVAVKLVRESGRRAAPASAALLREAQTMASLSHPNILTVYEAGRSGEEIYLAMEWVDGLTASQWRSADTRSAREILAVFLDAARGLDAAHRAGVVHRDFKPDNVLIGSDGRVRVCDFGLSRAERGHRGGDGPLAAPGRGGGGSGSVTSGALIGTPAYMAPEQLRGEPADARSDQFSFCIALYEALDGSRPFAGTDVAELRAAVEGGSPRPRSRRVPRVVLRHLLRGLELRPEDRFPSMTVLVEALEPAAQRLVPGRRLARWPAALAAVTAAAAVATGVGLVWRSTGGGTAEPTAGGDRVPRSPAAAGPTTPPDAEALGMRADLAAAIRTRYRALRRSRELHLYRTPLPRDAGLVRLLVERRPRDTFTDTIWVECTVAAGRLDPDRPCTRFYVTRQHDPTDHRPSRPAVELGPFPLAAVMKYRQEATR